MAKKIRWTNKALKSFSGIISYLQNDWSEKVAVNFELKLRYKLEILADYPFAGSISEIKPGYNKYVITKHNTLYYRVKKDEIIVLNIYDTRQNPQKIKL